MSESSSTEEYAHFFEVRLDLFDGPIDLLLHLVKSRELPIEELSLAQVTGQYFACIEAARYYDLEVAAEYLVIAATLLSIKSSVLLNQPVELIEDEEGNLVDPHQELLRRLREHEVYKQGAFQLSCRKLLGVDVFSPPSLLKAIEPPPARFKPHDAILLGMAFKKLLDKVPAGRVGIEIQVDSVTIVERMMSMVDRLREKKGALSFASLVEDLTSRASIVSAFIALLELMKRQAVVVRQDDVFGEITIALGGEVLDSSAMTSEFDSDNDKEQSEQVTAVG